MASSIPFVFVCVGKQGKKEDAIVCRYVYHYKDQMESQHVWFFDHGDAAEWKTKVSQVYTKIGPIEELCERLKAGETAFAKGIEAMLGEVYKVDMLKNNPPLPASIQYRLTMVESALRFATGGNIEALGNEEVKDVAATGNLYQLYNS